MGWTHDYRDAPRDRGSEATADATLNVSETTLGVSERRRGAAHAQHPDHDPQLGIPRIIRRRARWVSARLRHPRSR